MPESVNGLVRAACRRRAGTAWIVAGAALLAAGVGFWALVGDVPFLANPFRTVPLPAYLDSSAPAVAKASRDASSQREVITRLASELSVRAIDRALLWKSLDQFERDGAVGAWTDGRFIEFANAGPWAVPDDPDWTENPFDNVTWLSYYHSLAWLQAPGRLYRERQEVARRDEVAGYLLDWIEQNPLQQPASIRSWYDHTVAWRTDAIVNLFEPVLLDALDAQGLDTVLDFLWHHGELLNRYLSDARFTGNNHNLFHALALYNLAVAFPEFRHAARWKEAAHARIGPLLNEMVDEDGVSTEQAAGYHFLALGMFAAADDWFNAQGDPLPTDVALSLRGMADYAALLPWPDGTLPPYGDTRYGARSNQGLLEQLDARGAGSPQLRFVLTQGEQGLRPADLNIYPESGYAILRPSYGEAGAWTDDLHVLFDLGAWRRVHGHEDALNVLVWGAGSPLLVEGGGPYVYRDLDRRGFMSAQAHNTVIVDERGYDADDLEPVDGRLLGSGDSTGVSFVDAVHQQWGSVSHRRTVIVLKPSLLIVVDRLTSHDGVSHDYDLIWHLAPGADATFSQTGTTSWKGAVATSAAATIGLSVAASGPLTHDVVEGQQDPPLGWVATGILQREAAPVLRYRAQGGDSWFVTAIALPAGGERVPPPTIAAAIDGGDLALGIETDGGRWNVDLPLAAGAAPIVKPTD